MESSRPAVRVGKPYYHIEPLDYTYQTTEFSDIHDAENDLLDLSDSLDLDYDDHIDDSDVFNYDEDASDTIGNQYSGNYLDTYEDEVIRKSEHEAWRFAYYDNSEPKAETRVAFSKAINNLSEQFSEDTDSNVYDLHNLMKVNSDS